MVIAPDGAVVADARGRRVLFAVRPRDRSGYGPERWLVVGCGTPDRAWARRARRRVRADALRRRPRRRRHRVRPLRRTKTRARHTRVRRSALRLPARRADLRLRRQRLLLRLPHIRRRKRLVLRRRVRLDERAGRIRSLRSQREREPAVGRVGVGECRVVGGRGTGGRHQAGRVGPADRRSLGRGTDRSGRAGQRGAPNDARPRAGVTHDGNAAPARRRGRVRAHASWLASRASSPYIRLVPASLPPPSPMSTELRDRLQASLGTAYTLERELGGGGMSRVFVAEEMALGRSVVVKVLPPEMAAGVSIDRFKREIQVAARLQHPHIVPVLSAGETDGLPFYTMPLVEGASLRARLSRGGVTISETVGILREVARALAYAHDHGVVHRDIKPDNVLLSGGSAVVTDFGIAKALSAAKIAAPGATLTQLGTSIGTPQYMAPEQAAGDPATNHRADLYAFGVMAYELLAGRPPFHGLAPHKLMAAHMGERPQPILELRADTPPMLAELVMRLLEKDPDARPQSASDIARVLESVTSGSGGSQSAMPQVLLAGRGMLPKALAFYAAAFVLVAVLAKAAIVGIGLPSWVFAGAIIVMTLGLPVILFTAYVHRTTHRALTSTPTLTPGGTPSLAQGAMATIAMKASP